VFYHWTKIHKTLRVTPAMAADLTDRVWDIAEIVELMQPHPRSHAAPGAGRGLTAEPGPDRVHEM
jgi:hypothetical protein